MTNYGVLGTGVVGRTFAAKLSELGHEVSMGTRDVEAVKTRRAPADRPDQLSFAEWLEAHPTSLAPFADVIADAEVLINAVHAANAVDVLRDGGADNRDGTILIDVANPLDFSTGDLDLFVSVTDSFGETLQRTFPSLRVVKTLNMMNASVMVDPQSVGEGGHTVFMAGNHDAAKSEVAKLLHAFGWRDVRDLGDIAGARGMEAYLVLWLRQMQIYGNAAFNIKVVQ
jgi:predicted dinucleotide-binding enzyme